MHNNKLITILKHFNKTDFNQFGKYIVSPYFNKSQQLIHFFKLVEKGINSTKKSALNRENIWKKLFPNQKYNDVRFRKLNSDLLKLVEGFLSQKIYDSNKLQQVANLIESIGNKGIKKIYPSILKYSENVLKKHPFQDSDFYFNQYIIQKNFFEINQHQFKHSIRLNINEIDENLTYFFITEKLRYLCTVLSQKHRGFEYELSLINEVVKFSKKKSHQIPSIAIYYQIYLTYQNLNNEEFYYDLKNLLKLHGNKFHSVEAKTLYDSALNYCAIKLNKGLNNFLNETFDLYDDYLQKEAIYVDGELDPSHFKNIVTVALRLEKFDWTENFINAQKLKLPISSQENAFTFNLARLYWYKKEHSRVISLLQEVEYENMTYNLSSKAMLLATYYETEEIEPLYSLLESFRTYINRRKDIPERWRKPYLNLIKFTKKLMRLSPNDEKSLLKIKKEIAESDDIADAKWLKEKIAELEK